MKYDYYQFSDLPALIDAKGDFIDRPALVFGREESGLRNDELKLCNLITTVPLKKNYPSLNLAQSVMLYAWELSKMRKKKYTPARDTNSESLRVLLEKVRTVLTLTGFDDNSMIYSRFMERVNALGKNDLQLLHSFCNKFIEKQ